MLRNLEQLGEWRVEASVSEELESAIDYLEWNRFFPSS
jgi:hypothetical protein